jgi:hypothetical protein
MQQSSLYPDFRKETNLENQWYYISAEVAAILVKCRPIFWQKNSSKNITSVPGVSFMITDHIQRFLVNKLAFFSKNNVMIQSFQKIYLVCSKT